MVEVLGTLFLVLVLGSLFTVILYLARHIGPGWVLVNLGKRDEWWSPLRLLPPPGEMYFVVRGSADGPFDRVLDSVPDYEWDNDAHEFRKVTGASQEEDLFSENGVAWVGFFRKLMKREIIHLKYAQNDRGEWAIISKVRPGPSVFFRWNMATKIDGAEIAGNLTVDATIVYTVQLTDPVKAMFFAGNWEKQVAAAVQGRFRRYASDKTFEELLTERKKAPSTPTETPVVSNGTPQAVSAEIVGLTERGADDQTSSGLLNLFGVEILDARFVKVDIVGEEAARKAMQALEIAKREAQATVERADGEKQARIKKAEGDKAAQVLANDAQADYIERVFKPTAANERTVRVREAEAYERNTTVRTYAPGDTKKFIPLEDRE